MLLTRDTFCVYFVGVHISGFGSVTFLFKIIPRISQMSYFGTDSLLHNAFIYFSSLAVGCSVCWNGKWFSSSVSRLCNRRSAVVCVWPCFSTGSRRWTACVRLHWGTGSVLWTFRNLAVESWEQPFLFIVLILAWKKWEVTVLTHKGIWVKLNKQNPVTNE